MGDKMKKILIIEDDRALNKGITFNLKEEGFDVKGVYSLFEGRLIYVVRSD